MKIGAVQIDGPVFVLNIQYASHCFFHGSLQATGTIIPRRRRRIGIPEPTRKTNGAVHIDYLKPIRHAPIPAFAWQFNLFGKQLLNEPIIDFG